MNKKKLLTLTAAVALIGAMGVGATLAYFTDTEETKNVITMGNVNIKLTEESKSGDGSLTVGKVTDDGLSFDDVLPGETVAKKPMISLDGTSEDAYIRVKMEVAMTNPSNPSDKQEKFLEELQDNLTDTINKSNGWYYNSTDGYFYYTPMLDDMEDVAEFFETVTIPTDWDNDMADVEFSIKLTAEAIQADYLDGILKYTGEEISGWDLDTDNDGTNDITIQKYVSSGNAQ